MEMRKFQRGSSAILVGIVILSMLGIAGIAFNLFSSFHSKSQVALLNSLESFPANEIAAWSVYTRKLSNPNLEDGTQTAGLALEQNVDLDSVPDQQYNPQNDELTPYNIRATLKLNLPDSLSIFLRRTTSEKFQTLLQSNSQGVNYCGSIAYPGRASPNKNCLRSIASPVSDTFNQSRGFNNTVLALARASDGSGIYVGGTFNNFSAHKVGPLLRLKLDGTLDTSFNTGTGFRNTIDAMGSVSVYGLLSVQDGSGKVYVAGWFTHYNGVAVPGLMRLNADGSRDTSFSSPITMGPGGSGNPWAAVLFSAAGANNQIYALQRQILPSPIFCRTHLVRINQNGTLDATFNAPTFDNADIWIGALANNLNQVYLSGNFTIAGVTPIIIRLKADGSVDPTFTYAPGAGYVSYIPRVMQVLADGKFIIDVLPSNPRCLARFLTSGAIDPAYTPVPITGGNTDISHLILAPDASGDIYLAGNFFEVNGVSSRAIARLQPDGSVSPSFHIRSINDTPFAHLMRLETAPDGTLWAGGSMVAFDEKGVNNLAWVRPDGSMDARTTVGAGLKSSNDLVATADGKVYSSTFSSLYNGSTSKRLFRLNNDGSFDPSFISQFGEYLNSQDVAGPLSIPDSPAGTLFVGGGFSFYNGVNSRGIMRLLGDGTRDPTFDPGVGIGPADINSATSISAITPANDGTGRVYLGGQFSSYKGISAKNIIRIHSNGTLDTTFNPGTGPNNMVYAITASTDGSGDLFIGGGFTQYNGFTSNKMARIKSDGSFLSSFISGFTAGYPGYVYTIAPAIDSSGDVYVGGNFDSYNGTTPISLVRLSGTGNRISSFNIGSGFTSAATWITVGAISAITPLNDGTKRLYVGGTFIKYKGTTTGGIVLLKEDGSVDSSFQTGTGFNSAVKKIVLAPDHSNRIYVGGNFSTYNGVTTDGVVRLKPNGTLE